MVRLLESADFLVDFPHGRLAIVRVASAKVFADALHVRRGGRRPADRHLCLEHLLETEAHLVFFDEFAAIRVGFAFEHGGAETGVFLEQFVRVRFSIAEGEMRQLRPWGAGWHHR